MTHTTCYVTAKRAYSSPRAARLANLSNAKRLRTYRCRHCNGYHVTAQDVYGRSFGRRSAT